MEKPIDTLKVISVLLFFLYTCLGSLFRLMAKRTRILPRKDNISLPSPAAVHATRIQKALPLRGPGPFLFLSVPFTARISLRIKKPD